jgi:hypothetical protein
MNGFKTILQIILYLALITPVFSTTKIKKIKSAPVKEYVYYDKGMRHHLVVMNKDGIPAGLSKGTELYTIIDTIQHAHTEFPQFWDIGIQEYAVAGDTLTNWYWFAADTAKLLEIHASFATTGTGTWNVWEGIFVNNIGVVPNTSRSFLPLNFPWTIETANVNAQQEATGQWQASPSLSALNAIIPAAGAFVGYFTDGNNGPHMFMDDGDHELSDANWFPSRSWLSSQPGGGWFFWASPDYWTEYVQRIVVSYTKVAPLITIETNIQDYFAGNPAFNSISVDAEIVDLDGSVSSAAINWTIGTNGSVNTAAMSLSEDDLYSGTITGTFPAGQTIFYWVSATDNEGNSRDSFEKNFDVVQPPSPGTDYLLVNENGRLGIEVFEDALNNLDIQFYTWDIDTRGGISDYEINYSFGSIIWTGFGSASMPGPFETDAHPVKTALNNGKNLLLIDNDYLWIHDFVEETLSPGMFGYDYLGLYTGISDPEAADSVFYGHNGDPLGNGFYAPGDSLVTFPDFQGIWNSSYDTDWQDLLIPTDNASATFYNYIYDEIDNYSTAIRFTNGSFATAFFAFGVETADMEDLQTVLSNTLNWMETVNPSSIKINENGIVSDYKLNQNYPNPFNPTTIINYQLPVSDKVTIKIYDVNGREIHTLVNEKQNPGEYSIQFDASGLNSGVYFYSINTSSGFKQSKRMILIK